MSEDTAKYGNGKPDYETNGVEKPTLTTNGGIPR